MVQAKMTTNGLYTGWSAHRNVESSLSHTQQTTILVSKSRPNRGFNSSRIETATEAHPKCNSADVSGTFGLFSEHGEHARVFDPYNGSSGGLCAFSSVSIVQLHPSPSCITTRHMLKRKSHRTSVCSRQHWERCHTVNRKITLMTTTRRFVVGPQRLKQTAAQTPSSVRYGKNSYFMM